MEHGYAKDRCKHPTIAKFPKAIEDFAVQFIQLQEKRHAADYDPDSRFVRSEVQTVIDDAETAITDFSKVPIKDRRAFSAFVILKKR